MIRKYRHLSDKNKISKFPQVGKMSTDSNICHTSVFNLAYAIAARFTNHRGWSVLFSSLLSFFSSTRFHRPSLTLPLNAARALSTFQHVREWSGRRTVSDPL